MKSTVNFNDFCDSFTGGYKDNFSYEGKRALFDYLEELEDETGTELELDPIAFCCDFVEYDNVKECLAEYDTVHTLDELKDNTIVIEFEGGIIIQEF